ncbi:hypothetical protein V6259_12620 [Marinomonas sp. TI.3.20]|uniref:hypothetical protein n=1 Tax=Marinomonas sp. TI.3.20 TaxID=3121296 RepID=UPI00311F71C6
MIISHLDSSKIHLWTTGNEILQRGYFGGELNLLTALAQVIVHEFSHVIQVILNTEDAAKSHGKLFYKILDKAHVSGMADRIKDELNSRCLDMGVDLSEVKSTGTGKNSKDFSIGQTVWLAGRYSYLNPFKVTYRKRNLKLVSLKDKDKTLLAHPSYVYSTAEARKNPDIDVG